MGSYLFSGLEAGRLASLEAKKSCVHLAFQHSGFQANNLSIMGPYMLSRLQLKIAKGATICYSMPEVRRDKLS